MSRGRNLADILGPPKLGRRVGLTRHLTTTSLLESVHDPAKNLRETMPAKPATKLSSGGSKEVPANLKQNDDENIHRLPDSSSEDERPSPNIKSTKFEKGSSKEKVGISALSKKQDKPTVHGKAWRDESGGYRGTSRRTATNTDNSPSSSASTNSSKRKSPTERGAGMVDDFGRITANKRVKNKFGSSQPRSSQQKALSQKSIQNKDSSKITYSVPNSPTSDSSPRKRFQTHRVDTPTSTPRAINKFKMPSMSPEKEEEEEETKFEFKACSLDDLEESFNLSSQSQDLDISLPALPEAPKNKATEPPQATQKTLFKVYDLDDDVLEKAVALIGDRKDKPPVILDDDQFLTMTQRGRCPMCNAPVDSADIREFGKNMNIRMQEKFCRAHRMRTAKEDWEDRNYPTIKWEKLDRRITQHHTLIKKLIKGETSYYREQMEEKVKAGKDRSLLKMTTNLTPGYYGTRGLRAISENIMHKFTTLLKKRMVEDELMSARGFTPYVQSVLVPEIASRLIMNDMKVSLERAREILSESTEVGELLNEEIRDVVKKTVSDSEDEDENDEEEE